MKKKIICLSLNLICAIFLIFSIYTYTNTKNDFKKFEFDGSSIETSNILLLNSKIKENLNISSKLYLENDLSISISNLEIKDINIDFKYTDHDKYYNCTVTKDNNYKIHEEITNNKYLSDADLKDMLEVVEASYKILSNITLIKGYSSKTTNSGVIGKDYIYKNKEIQLLDEDLYGEYFRISLTNTNNETIQIYYKG